MRARSLPTTALLFALTGCCPLARFLCGPDKTPWVSVDCTTPEATVRTLLESLRRDEPTVLYRCLASDYVRELGLDDVTMQLAWTRITAANPGLHVAGYAEVPPARRLAADVAEVTLAIEGRTLRVRLQRISQWHVRYERPLQPPTEPDGEPWQPPPGEVSRVLGPGANPLAIQQASDEVEVSKLAIAPLRIEHYGVDSLRADDVDFFGVERLWKVTDVRMLE